MSSLDLENFRYYQKEWFDHLYTTATEEIRFDLKVGDYDYGQDQYRYQGIECYAFSLPGDRIIEDWMQRKPSETC